MTKGQVFDVSGILFCTFPVKAVKKTAINIAKSLTSDCGYTLVTAART